MFSQGIFLILLLIRLCTEWVIERQRIKTPRTSSTNLYAKKGAVVPIDQRTNFGSIFVIVKTMRTRLETAEHLRTLSALVLNHLERVETNRLREGTALACFTLIRKRSLAQTNTYQPQ